MSERPEMKSVAVKRDILLDLDAALDTRMGTVARLNQTAAYKALTNGYHLRKIDRFDGVDNALYNERYANRDTETLKHSVITNIFRSVREIIVGAAMADSQRNRDIRCTVVVNTWPYSLSTEESDAIRDMVKLQLYAQVEVEVVNLSPDELTPSYCSEHYGVMIKYDYYYWLEVQTQMGNIAPGKQLMHSVKLLVPNVYFVEVPTDEQIRESRELVGLAPLEETEQMLRQIIDAEMIPVTHFSVMSDTIDGHMAPPPSTVTMTGMVGGP